MILLRETSENVYDQDTVMFKCTTRISSGQDSMVEVVLLETEVL